MVAGCLSVLTMAGALGLGGLSGGAPAFAATSSPYQATAGILTPVATVDPQQLALATPAGAATRGIARGARRVHPRGPASQATVAAPTSLAASATSQVLTNFNGVSSLDSAVTNFGAEFEPPDQGLCVGNGFVLEAVNSAYTVYRTNGAVVAGPFNVNALFDEGLKQFTSDPRCYFDRSTNTWFAIILFINATNTGGRTDLAVNTSGDPTKPWTIYHINGTDDGTNGMPNNPGCPCFGDQPLLGLDHANVYISTNEFSILGPQFNGAQIYAIAKTDLVALAPRVHVVHYGNLMIGGALAASVQPAITYGSPSAEFFLSSLDPTATTDDRLGVWALAHQPDIATGGMPPLSHVVIASEPYGVPPGAVQKGATSLLDAGDDRMMQVEYINGVLWGALGTTVTPNGDTTSRAGVAWFRVQPHLTGSTIASAVVRAQGYVTAPGNYLLYPALAVAPDGTAAMVVTISGATRFASAAYTVLAPQQAAFGAIQIVAAGTGPYDPAATRWGDYSAAALAPDSGSFWFATEYIPPLSSQTTDRLRNWGTRVFQVNG
jgi:hypothetical protein